MLINVLVSTALSVVCFVEDEPTLAWGGVLNLIDPLPVPEFDFFPALRFNVGCVGFEGTSFLGVFGAVVVE